MIIPSIDLMGGKVVQLEQGKKKKLELANYESLIDKFSILGEISLIDLDAAIGKGDNIKIIKDICKKIDCRVGGGIRDIGRAKEMIKLGASQIIIGTSAFDKKGINKIFLEDLKKEIGKERIIIAIDTNKGNISIKGWTQELDVKTEDIVKELEPYCSEFLLTIVDKEGLMKGTDIDFIKKIKDKTSNVITAAGGISSYDEIKKLEEMEVNSVLGMALYSKKITLEESFISSLKFNERGLIPTIVESGDGQVLMFAYSNKESLLKAFSTKKGWYFSRSRDKLWMKGEESGNTQDILQIKKDCDGDVVLFKVKQKNFACHRGTYSCFGKREFSLEELYEVLLDRVKNPMEGSYTSKISSDENKIMEKIAEESEEVINYEDDDNLVWEIGDLIYFLLVLMAKKGIKISDIKRELRRRRK